MIPRLGNKIHELLSGALVSEQNTFAFHNSTEGGAKVHEIVTFSTRTLERKYLSEIS